VGRKIKKKCLDFLKEFYAEIVRGDQRDVVLKNIRRDQGNFVRKTKRGPKKFCIEKVRGDQWNFM
jgi:hypothetical protein